MNKEQVYDEQIHPLVGQIIDICQKNGIEMLINFWTPTEEDPTLQVVTSLPDENVEISNVHGFAMKLLLIGQQRVNEKWKHQ